MRKLTLSWDGLGLRGRLLAMIALLLVLGGALSHSLQLQREAEDGRADIARDMNKTMDLLEVSLAEHVISGDHAAIQRILTPWAQHFLVDEIQWRDSSGAVIKVQAIQHETAAYPLWFHRMFGFNPNEQLRDMVVGERRYGVILAKFSSVPLENRLWRETANQLWQSGLGLVLLMWVVYLLLGRWLKPLKSITAMGHHLLSGDYLLAGDYRSTIAVSSHFVPEIRDMARVLNQAATEVGRLGLSLFEQRRAVDNAVVVIESDLNGIITDVNGKFCEVSGYSREEVIGRDHRFLNSGLHPRTFFDALWTDLQRGKTWQGEVCNRTRSGGIFWLLTTITPIMGPDGKPLKYISVRVDITQRKLAEQALCESEDRFRGTFEQAAAGMAHVSPDGRFLRVNRKLCEIVGYSEEEMKARTFQEITYAEDLQEDLDKSSRLLAGEISTFNMEKRYIRKDGALVWINLTVSLVREPSGEPKYFIGVIEDISRRKLVEQSLCESEDRFRGTFEQAAVGMAHVSPDGRFLRVNHKLCEIVGYSGEELMALTFQDITYAEDLQADLDKVSRVLAGEIQTYDMEKRYIRKDGVLVWINLTVSLVREPSGEPKYFIVVIDDISRRKLAEGVLSQQSQIINQTHDAVFSTDSRGTLVSWNRGAELLFGHGSDAAIGQPVEFIALPGEQKLFYQHAFLGLIRSGGGVLETRLAKKSGEPFDAWFSLSLLKDNEGMEIGVACYVADISTRKRMEYELRESETRLAKAQQMARLGSWDWEIATGEILWSDEVYHIFGLDQGTPVTFDLFLGSVHPEDRELVEKSLTAALAREVNYNVDIRIFPAGGEVRFIHAEGEVEFDGEGKALRMFGTVQDITERKEIEQEIRASREQLRELSSHLQAAREEEKAAIAREIHDELGGNLTALKMDISWLARKLPPEMDVALEKTGAMADLVDTSVQAMRRIVTELRPTVLDDLGLLAAMQWQAAEFSKRYGIQCTVAMHGEEILVGDACRIALFRIFQESLTNAARYSKADRVQVDVWREHDKIALDIVDNGIGLPEDTAMDPTSHGLRGMMERARTLGGTVEVGSAPGEGVAISVRIPLQAKEEVST